MDLNIDIEKLKKDLLDFFLPYARINDLARKWSIIVSYGTPEEIIKIANMNNFDLGNYQISNKLAM